VQILISRTSANWAKWIIPAFLLIVTTTFYIYNLTDAFANLVQFGRFLVYHQGPGLFAFILKTGVIFSPFIVSLVIFIIFRVRSNKKQNKNKSEIEKMLIKDLS
jgi:hypothetical protein